MIRINLLPFRAARRKENIRRQVSVFVLMIIFVMVTLVWYTMSVDKKIDRVKIEIANVKQQTTLYKEKADRVTEIKKKLEVLDRKLELVADLKSKRREPIILLDTLTQVVVPDRMWLTALKTDTLTGAVSLKGIAFDNKTVADFMVRLEQASLFSAVDLQKLERISIAVGNSNQAGSRMRTSLQKRSGRELTKMQGMKVDEKIQMKSFEIVCIKTAQSAEEPGNHKQGKPGGKK